MANDYPEYLADKHKTLDYGFKDEDMLENPMGTMKRVESGINTDYMTRNLS